jgi:hypothetical protein
MSSEFEKRGRRNMKLSFYCFRWSKWQNYSLTELESLHSYCAFVCKLLLFFYFTVNSSTHSQCLYRQDEANVILPASSSWQRFLALNRNQHVCQIQIALSELHTYSPQSFSSETFNSLFLCLSQLFLCLTHSQAPIYFKFISILISFLWQYVKVTCNILISRSQMGRAMAQAVSGRPFSTEG